MQAALVCGAMVSFKRKRATKWSPVLVPGSLSTLGRGTADSALAKPSGAGGSIKARYPRERDSLAVRPFTGTRARLGTFIVPTPANDSTPAQASPAGEPSPTDFVPKVSASQGEVAPLTVAAFWPNRMLRDFSSIVGLVLMALPFS